MNRLNCKSAYCLAITVGFACGMAVTSTTATAEPANTNISSESSPKTVPAAPLSQRFADDQAKETPDFQKHVVPLLGRLGCNGRACHGSFQGRGGFQLSLFGYDFKGDHQRLLDEATGRVDVDDVDESLILSKPTDADMHEGGKRYDLGSWQHHVLRSWVAGGAKFNDSGVQKLVRLEIIPSEIQFTTGDETADLKAVAYWQDGTVEDVTELCRFNSNDDGIATIDNQGHVKSGQPGDTHLVVFYDNAVVPVPLLRPIGPTDKSSPQPSHPIDQLVQQKLDKLGITPSGICTDEEFIRRASLDITGILPSGQRVREFLADTATDKRARLVEELLQSPGYAAWWATRLSDWTGNSEAQLNNVLPMRGAASRLWHEWLRARLEKNVPYDEMVEGIVTASNRQQGESYIEYCEKMTQACKPGNEGMFAERDGLPFYWARRNFQKPEERAIGFAYAFLGVRIECAQCHKHPFDQWSKDDFDQFAKIFTPIRVNQNQVAADAKKDRDMLLEKLTAGRNLKGGDLRKAVYKAAQDGQTVPFGELLVNTRGVSEKEMQQRKAAIKKGRKVPPLNTTGGKILGQEELVALDKDPRIRLMQWLRAEDNPYFAKAIVNRVWSNYFGAGIVDPTDDMNLANPPSNTQLLDHLAKQFIANDFDLKWLHRTIVSSETYQRSADTNASNQADRVNLSHHIPRRLPAEVVYDSIALATGSDSQVSKLRGEVDAMAIAEGKPRGRNQQDFALEVFGQSIRETNCDCDRSDSPSLLQSIYLRNDSDMHKRLADKDGWVAQACKSLGVAGPNAAANPKQAAIEREAQNLKGRVVQRVRQFNNLSEERREKMRDQLTREYDRLTAKFTNYGYAVPRLETLIASPDAWDELEQKQKSGKQTEMTIQQLVEDAYLRTLSRYPDAEESQIALTFIEESKTPADGVQSLLWALVNTKEFIISH